MNCMSESLRMTGCLRVSRYVTVILDYEENKGCFYVEEQEDTY